MCPLAPMHVETKKCRWGETAAFPQPSSDTVCLNYSHVDPPPHRAGSFWRRADSPMSLDRRETSPSQSRSPTTDLSCADAGDAISAGQGRGCSDSRTDERLRLAPTVAPTWRGSSGRCAAAASSALLVRRGWLLAESEAPAKGPRTTDCSCSRRTEQQLAMAARPSRRRAAAWRGPRTHLSQRRAGARHGPRVAVPGRPTLPPTGSCSPRPPAPPATSWSSTRPVRLPLRRRAPAHGERDKVVWVPGWSIQWPGMHRISGDGRE
jgi:hypothetical protein